MMNITKTGILATAPVEPFITLSDGSKWQLLLYHQVDNGTRLFTAQNNGYCNDFGLFSRLQWIDSFTYDNKYEFYVIQDYTNKYRWTQTNAPLTTTAVANFTAILDTPDVTGTSGGGICKGVETLALLAATNTSSNWTHACGAIKNYTRNGVTGVPGFGTDWQCSNYMALYARINKPITFVENNVIQGSELYEY